MANYQCLSLANRKSLDVSRISKNYLAITEARRKAGWIQCFSKNESESLIINLKKKARKLHLSSTIVHPILKLADSEQSTYSFFLQTRLQPYLMALLMTFSCLLRKLRFVILLMIIPFMTVAKTYLIF